MGVKSDLGFKMVIIKSGLFLSGEMYAGLALAFGILTGGSCEVL